MVSRDHALSSALEHLRKALALLDETAAPAQIGAHIDLAASQLQELVTPRADGTKNLLGDC